MCPALLRVRPQPGAVPEEEPVELQQALPPVPPLQVQVTGGWGRHEEEMLRVCPLLPTGFCAWSRTAGLSCAPTRMGRVGVEFVSG